MRNCLIRVTLLSVSQGHPTTVFCKISVRRNKYCLEIFCYLRTAKNSYMTVPFTYSFRRLSYDSLRFSEVSFSHFTSQVRLFSVEKREPKIIGLKNVVMLKIRKCLTFVIGQISSKIFGKIILKPLR